MANPAVETAMKGLEAIGIVVPPSMEGLIEMLVNEGEDVLTAIPHIVSIIEQLGGNVWQTLDEVGSGMQHAGPVGYVQQQIDLAFDPHISRIQDIHQSKQTLLAVHRDALATLKTGVNTLAPGGASTQQQSYTGASADAMVLSFNVLSAEMTAHLDLLEQSLLIDQHFLTNIQTVKTVSAGIAIITLIIVAVVLIVALALAPVTGGISLAVGGGIVITLSAGDAALLLGAIIATFAAWGMGHELLGHAVQVNWGDATPSVTSTSHHQTTSIPVTHYTYEYEPNPKHGPTQKGNIGAEPQNGQAALDNSVPVKPTSTRRVGVDPSTGEIVVIDETYPGKGIFHGHVRSWDELTQEMKNALINAGLVDKRGRPIKKK